MDAIRAINEGAQPKSIIRNLPSYKATIHQSHAIQGQIANAYPGSRVAQISQVMLQGKSIQTRQEMARLGTRDLPKAEREAARAILEPLTHFGVDDRGTPGQAAMATAEAALKHLLNIK